MKYTLKNYMLSMKSNWFINQPLYQAVEESIPSIAKYRVSEGTENLEKTPVSRMCKNPFPDIYTVPLFRRAWCKMMVEEIKEMEKHIAFKVNDEEDELRQIPEIILRDHVPQLYERMWFVVQTVLNPLFLSLYQRDCFDISAIQIANYNPKDKKAGAWHHDESSDISVVIPLNTGDYIGGGTEFHNHGVLKPLPSGHALIFPSFTNLHRGLPVESGDRYLLVMWLHDKKRAIHMVEDL